MTEVQDKILLQEGRLAGCRIDVRKLHLTLAVLHIKDEQQLERAKRLMEEVAEEARAALLPGGGLVPPSLVFSGLGAFRKDVLFIKPQDGDTLEAIRHMAR